MTDARFSEQEGALLMRHAKLLRALAGLQEANREEGTMKGTQTIFDDIAQRASALEKVGRTRDEAVSAAATEAIEELARVAVEKSAGLTFPDALIEVTTKHPELLALRYAPYDYTFIDAVEVEKIRSAAIAQPRSVDEIWGAIQKAAHEAVQKSGGALNLPAAIDLVVDSPGGRELLAEYRDAKDREALRS